MKGFAEFNTGNLFDGMGGSSTDKGAAHNKDFFLF